MARPCGWFDAVYYSSVKSKPKVNDRYAKPMKQMIDAEPSFGDRTVATTLTFNKNTVQRVSQPLCCQVRKTAIRHRPRFET
jgi:putative transposase